MNIEGLDYNTQRERIKLNEYGREIQQMVDYCVSIPDREERQVCAEAIIDTMRKMNPSDQNINDRIQTLWDHLALMSDFKLDIDYPVEITTAEQMASKPEPVAYPNTRILYVSMAGHCLSCLRRSRQWSRVRSVIPSCV